MARQRKILPARKPEVRDDSLLLRSAESLGRMIGTLQRQLDVASKQFTSANGSAADATRKKSATRKKTTRSAARPDTRKTAAKKTAARSSGRK